MNKSHVLARPIPIHALVQMPIDPGTIHTSHGYYHAALSGVVSLQYILESPCIHLLWYLSS
jgi:hypothetical protein